MLKTSKNTQIRCHITISFVFNQFISMVEFHMHNQQLVTNNSTTILSAQPQACERLIHGLFQVTTKHNNGIVLENPCSQKSLINCHLHNMGSGCKPKLTIHVCKDCTYPLHTHRCAHAHTYIQVGRMSCKSGRNAKDMRVPLLSMKSMQPNKYNKYDLTKA